MMIETISDQASADIAFLETAAEYNAADASMITRYIASAWNKVAEPLVGPFAALEERNHTAGVIAVNSVMTAPRLLDVPLANAFVEQVQAKDMHAARKTLGMKLILKATDGLDGPVARGSHATSEFGAGFDPAVDMAGSAADIWAIMKLAQAEGDKAVVRMMKLGLASDIGAIAAGGILNGAAGIYAKKNAVQLDASEQARSNADGKLKYGLKSAGNALLLLSYTCEDPKQKASLRRQGLLLNGMSNAVGAVSIVRYTTSGINKFKKIRSLKS